VARAHEQQFTGVVGVYSDRARGAAADSKGWQAQCARLFEPRATSERDERWHHDVYRPQQGAGDRGY
jgi:hypothetical protein